MSWSSIKKSAHAGPPENSEWQDITESGEHLVDITETGVSERIRQEMTVTLENTFFDSVYPKRFETPEVDPDVEKQLISLWDSRDRVYISSVEQLEAEILRLSRLSGLYKIGTLEAHMEFARKQERTGHAAHQVYEENHLKGGLHFSDFNNTEPNAFVRHLVEAGDFVCVKGEKLLVLELGPGTGKDLRYIAVNVPQALCMGVDASGTMVARATRISKEEGLKKKIDIIKGNFNHTLAHCKGMLIDIILANSTLHYDPEQVSMQITFPRIADVLRERSEERKQPGKIFFAMKLGASDSANSRYQIALAPDFPGNPRVDLRSGGISREYPWEEKTIRQRAERNGIEIIESKIIDIRDYDRKGETERFAWEKGRILLPKAA